MLTESDYKNILHTVPGLYLILSSDFNIVEASDAYLDATLTKREAVTNKYIFDVFPDNPDEAEATGEHNLTSSLKRVLSSKKPDTMAVQKYDVRQEDGVFVERYWSCVNTPILDDHKNVKLIVHRALDVTEHVKSNMRQQKLSHILEEMVVATDESTEHSSFESIDLDSNIESRNIEKTLTLLSKEKQFNEALDYMIEGMQIIGTDWKYRYINKAAAQQGRYLKEELLGRTMMEVYPGIESSELFTVMRKCMSDHKPQSIINEFVFADHTKEWFELSIQPIPEGLIILSVNITDRKLAEDEIKYLNEGLEQKVTERTQQLEVANRELEAFSYSVSHDLRAPLRSINGFTRILLEEHMQHLDDEAQRYLNIIAGNSKKMGQLIDDLLAFSRLGRQEIVQVSINMKNLVELVVSEVKDQYPETQVIINPLSFVSGDYGLLKQVLQNLILNAFKYSHKKERPIIEIGYYVTEKEHVFFVKDNGAGFDMLYYDKLFNVFQRLHKQKEYDGTGVGLSIVKRIVQKHHGRVWAEGKPDEGATFYFSLPT